MATSPVCSTSGRHCTTRHTPFGRLDAKCSRLGSASLRLAALTDIFSTCHLCPAGAQAPRRHRRRLARLLASAQLNGSLVNGGLDQTVPTFACIYTGTPHAALCLITAVLHHRVRPCRCGVRSCAQGGPCRQAAARRPRTAASAAGSLSSQGAVEPGAAAAVLVAAGNRGACADRSAVSCRHHHRAEQAAGVLHDGMARSCSLLHWVCRA